MYKELDRSQTIFKAFDTIRDDLFIGYTTVNDNVLTSTEAMTTTLFKGAETLKTKILNRYGRHENELRTRLNEIIGDNLDQDRKDAVNQIVEQMLSTVSGKLEGLFTIRDDILSAFVGSTGDAETIIEVKIAAYMDTIRDDVFRSQEAVDQALTSE